MFYNESANNLKGSIVFLFCLSLYDQCPGRETVCRGSIELLLYAVDSMRILIRYLGLNLEILVWSGDWGGVAHRGQLLSRKGVE